MGLAEITLVRIIASREQATAEFKARGELGSMAMKPDDELRGAAFHEAGHVIVAREFRLPVGEIAIGIDGDDAIGRAEIGSAHVLKRNERTAKC